MARFTSASAARSADRSPRPAGRRRRRRRPAAGGGEVPIGLEPSRTRRALAAYTPSEYSNGMPRPARGGAGRAGRPPPGPRRRSRAGLGSDARGRPPAAPALSGSPGFSASGCQRTTGRLAAPASSRRRTGVVYGALRTLSGVLLRLLEDRADDVHEVVERLLGLGLGRLDHQRLVHEQREVDRRRVDLWSSSRLAMSSVLMPSFLWRRGRQDELVHADAVEGIGRYSPIAASAAPSGSWRSAPRSRDARAARRRRASGCRRRSGRTRRSCPGSRAAGRSTWAGRSRGRSGVPFVARARPPAAGRNGSMRSDTAIGPAPGRRRRAAA